jgi:hypothetical protein
MVLLREVDRHRQELVRALTATPDDTRELGRLTQVLQRAAYEYADAVLAASHGTGPRKPIDGPSRDFVAQACAVLPSHMANALVYYTFVPFDQSLPNGTLGAGASTAVKQLDQRQRYRAHVQEFGPLASTLIGGRVFGGGISPALRRTVDIGSMALGLRHMAMGGPNGSPLMSFQVHSPPHIVGGAPRGSHARVVGEGERLKLTEG